jgi:hypothetical protein
MIVHPPVMEAPDITSVYVQYKKMVLQLDAKSEHIFPALPDMPHRIAEQCPGVDGSGLDTAYILDMHSSFL